jgi:hypothetical protein
MGHVVGEVEENGGSEDSGEETASAAESENEEQEVLPNKCHFPGCGGRFKSKYKLHMHKRAERHALG